MDILLDFYIKSTPKQVFAAISDPVELINWWPLRCSGKPELDAEYNLYFEEPYDWYGKVCEVKEDESFYIKMTKSDKDWDPTTFGYKLEPHKDGTMVYFSHKNWQENNHQYRHSTYCWAVLFKGLKNYLEKGEVLPFEKRG